MRPDRLWAQIPCFFGRHRRSRSRAVRVPGRNGGFTYASVCRRCGIPMERLHQGHWAVSPKASGASGRWVLLAWAAAGLVVLGGAAYLAKNLSFGTNRAGADMQLRALAPNDEHLVFSHFAGELVRNAQSARIVRPIDTTDQGDSSGLKYAAPGARVSLTVLQEAAGPVSFDLAFDGLMSRVDMYNAAGVVLVDGAVAARYDMPIEGDEVPIGDLSASANVPAGRHTVSLVLPYGASVALTGVSVPGTARVTAGPRPPALRVVLIGDSRLNGAGASDITGTIAFQLAQTLDAEVINLANGGRQLAASDFAEAAKLAPDLAYSLFDFNNFYPGGESLDGFGLNYATGIREFLVGTERAGKPHARLFVVTSFASTSDADSETPGAYARNTPSLEAFRQRERREVAGVGSTRVAIVEGRGRGMPGASPPDSADGVHFSSSAQQLQASALAAAARRADAVKPR